MDGVGCGRSEGFDPSLVDPGVSDRDARFPQECVGDGTGPEEPVAGGGASCTGSRGSLVYIPCSVGPVQGRLLVPSKTTSLRNYPRGGCPSEGTGDPPRSRSVAPNHTDVSQTSVPGPLDR